MNLGALKTLAVNVNHAARMTVIDVATQMPLKDQNGNDCYIEFLSVDSEIGRKIELDRSRAQVRKMRANKNIDDDPIEVQVEMLTALATGWSFGDGADPFTKEGARALFSDQEYAWLRKQAYVFVYTEANFFKTSSKPSSPSPSGNSGGAAA